MVKKESMFDDYSLALNDAFKNEAAISAHPEQMAKASRDSGSVEKTRPAICKAKRLKRV